MKTYTVHLSQTATTSVIVKAQDKYDAIDKAMEKAPSGVCANCAGMFHEDRPGIELSGEWYLFDENDVTENGDEQ